MHSTNTATSGNPQHIAIIMDGNGRWADGRGLPRIEGHRQGVENVRTVLRAAREFDIRYLTLYAFSVENWQRPSDEVAALMSLLEFFLDQHQQELIDNQIRLHIIGCPETLPESVQKRLEKAVQATAGFDRYQLNLALSYGARTEVLDAVKRYSVAVLAGREQLDQLDYATFSHYLYTNGIPDPDLLIRTSGEMRMSNFLLLQCAYSELHFTPVCWPDFGRDELHAAIEHFKHKERRFGKTSEQVRSQLCSSDSFQNT